MKRPQTLSIRLDDELKDQIIDHSIDNWSTPSKIAYKILKNYYEPNNQTIKIEPKSRMLSKPVKKGTGATN